MAASKRAPAQPQQSQPGSSQQPQSQNPTEAREELAEPKEVQSSMLATVAWSEDELEVVFQSGSEESYRATEAEARELLGAPSKGKWMWQRFQPHPIGGGR